MSEYYFSLYVWENVFLATFAISFLLIIWFETHAFVEYARLLGFKLGSFETSEQMGLDFPAHLALKHDSFYVRLITCPICVCVWLSIAAAVILDYAWVLWNPFLSFFIVFYFSMMKYFLFKFLMHKSDN